MDDLARIYLNQLILRYQSLSPGLLRSRSLPNLPLHEVYVPLTLRVEAGLADLPDTGHTEADNLQQPFSVQANVESHLELHARERYLAQSEAGLSIDMLWKRGQQWVLLGAPGAGKTTLLHYLSLTQAQNIYNGSEGHFPLYISLESFARCWQNHPEWTLEQAMWRYLQQWGPVTRFTEPKQQEQLFAYIEHALQHRMALLLFDGLDTIHDAILRQRSSLAIDALLDTYPGNRCLITARPISYQPGLLGHSFRTAALEPFNPRQIHQFFQQWLHAIEKQKHNPLKPADASAERQVLQQASAFVNHLEQKPTINAYLRSPLLCTLTGLIQQQLGDLPEHQADLYRLYIDAFIKHWLVLLPDNDEEPPLSSTELHLLLEDIALYFQESCADNRSHKNIILQVVQMSLKQQAQSDEDASSAPVMNAPEREAALLSPLESPSNTSPVSQKMAQFQYLLSLDTGLLIHHGNEEYGFFHLAFQEYLAACAMTRSPLQIDHYLRLYLFNPHWQGIIRLAAAHQGMLNESLGSSFISMLQRYPHTRETDMHYTFRIAFLCLRDIQVSSQTADQMLQTAVHLYLTQPVLQPSLNRLLKNVEGVSYSPQAITPLFESLQHPEPAVRANTAEVLGHLGDQRVLMALKTLLQHDEYALVRSKVAEALGHFQDPDSVPLLLNVLSHDKSFVVRHYSARTLAKIAADQTLPNLLQHAKDAEPVLRSRMIEALGYLGDKTAMPLLLDSLQQDPQASVRWRAAEALGHLKDASACDALLFCLKQDHDPMVRGRAAEALGYFKQSNVVTGLLDALALDHFPAVRWRAAESLGYLQDDTALPTLRRILRNDVDNAVRWSAAQALGQIKDREAVEDLIATLREDFDPNVRWSAAEALGHLHDDSAVESLLKVLKYERYPLVRSKACEALGRLRDMSVTPELLSVLHEAPEPTVRAHVAKALGFLQDPMALTPLMSILREDEDTHVRWSAADALGHLKNPAAIPALLATLREDKELSVAWRAAQALELIDVGCLL